MSSSKLFKFLKTGSVVLLAVLVIALPIATLAKKTVKIGYYDLEAVQKDLPAFQQLRDSLKQKQVELENFRGNLYREYQLFYQESTQKLNDQKKGKSPEEQSQLEMKLNETLQQKISAINRQIAEKQQENEQFQTVQISAIRENLNQLIAMVAAKKKLDVVVEKSPILYGKQDLAVKNSTILYGENDITPLIIAQAKKDAEKTARIITPTPTATKLPTPEK
jgi:Skp family chaperone for outer membrane proteins